MSFVGAPFTHDLFISYSHGSDAGGDGLLRPWSVRFVEELRRELALDRRFRDPLRIFLDAQHRPGLGIDPMEGLSEQLAREVGASALLMVLMSPEDLKSAYVVVGKEQVPVASIPAGERMKIMSALKTKGLPVTEQAIAELWVKAGKPR